MPNRLPGVKSVIAIGSGKGGVGKSTVAANLSLALMREKSKVGLLDADIYGPSIPIMFGIPEGERPTVASGNRIIPLKRYDMPLMSMGFLMGSKDAVIWRGPMLAKMLQQFLEQVDWGELDYLIVDLPPGTGDVQLSLSQMIPMTGAVVVTTPQDVALADVRRAIKMFEMTKVPILGVIENMSTFECPHCKKESRIFGGKEDRYKDWGFPLLGSIPIEVETRVAGDEGSPIVVKEPKSKQADCFREIARKIKEFQGRQEELKLPSL
ncbi:MAG: Mrp/NBP35 family ATP-binding protein [Deltaproteobacteria bacterium]|nr:Mrp/NBP35 family ATP-binding protein [Deltaproteobacteria bacterium]